VSEEVFVLCNELSCLVGTQTERTVALAREYYLFHKAFRVFYENISALFVCKVVEEVFEKHSGLGTVSAVDEAFLHLPRNWTEVAVLRKRLFEGEAIQVHVLHFARPFLAHVEEEVTAELHKRLQILVYGLERHVLHEPTRLSAINAGHVFKESAEEESRLCQVRKLVLQTQ